MLLLGLGAHRACHAQVASLRLLETWDWMTPGHSCHFVHPLLLLPQFSYSTRRSQLVHHQQTRPKGNNWNEWFCWRFSMNSLDVLTEWSLSCYIYIALDFYSNSLVCGPFYCQTKGLARSLRTFSEIGLGKELKIQLEVGSRSHKLHSVLVGTLHFKVHPEPYNLTRSLHTHVPLWPLFQSNYQPLSSSASSSGLHFTGPLLVQCPDRWPPPNLGQQQESPCMSPSTPFCHEFRPSSTLAFQCNPTSLKMNKNHWADLESVITFSYYYSQLKHAIQSGL